MAAVLPEPSYIDRDAVQILKDCIARYESDPRGGPLGPTTRDRLLLDIFVYREVILRIGVQEAAKLNTLRYSRYPMIDLLAEILGTDAARLAARPALTTIVYTLDDAQGTDTPIAAGKRVRTKDGKVMFAVAADSVIPTGETVSDPILAIATTVGVLGNGYAPGQIVELIDLLDAPASVTNTTESNDGAAEEDTEAMRARIPDATSRKAAAGPENAYKAHAKAVSQNIVDVAVTETQLVPCTCGSTPPRVEITLLTKTGAPSTELIDQVDAALTPTDVRPFNDRIDVLAADQVDYAIDVSLVLYASEDEADAIDSATNALQAYVAKTRSALGRAPVDGEIITEVKNATPAVKNVIVNAPSPNPAVAEIEWANCTGIAVNVDSHVAERRPT